VIVAEMTDDHAMVLPLMVAAVIAYGTSRLICAEGIYHALAKNFLASADGKPPVDVILR
jgi:H+/Cl- antiporter ClcA